MAHQPAASEITHLLAEWTAGRSESAPQLWVELLRNSRKTNSPAAAKSAEFLLRLAPRQVAFALYRELRQVPRAYTRHELPDRTLQAAELVNEAYPGISRGKRFRWENRKHFFCALAQMMRSILVDHARECAAQKTAGELETACAVSNSRPKRGLALDESLEEVDKFNLRQALVVEMRLFEGLTVDQTAAMLNISLETAKLDWRFAKAGLQRQMWPSEDVHGGR